MALSRVDRDALERAIEICRAQRTPAHREQIEAMLEDRPWIDVATFAAYSCQGAALHLKPWQSPPAWIDNLSLTLAAGDDGIGGDFAAAKLLSRMLRSGLSRYEPDPLKALEAAKTLPPAA